MTCEGASFFRFLSWLASPSRCEILRLVSLGRRNRGGHSPSHADVTSEQLRSSSEPIWRKRRGARREDLGTMAEMLERMWRNWRPRWRSRRGPGQSAARIKDLEGATYGPLTQPFVGRVIGLRCLFPWPRVGHRGPLKTCSIPPSRSSRLRATFLQREIPRVSLAKTPSPRRAAGGPNLCRR